MRTVKFKSRCYPVDELGFLTDSSQWDAEFAASMAPGLGLTGGLSKQHWAVIRYIRETFLRTGKCPLVYDTCRARGLKLPDLKKLFPPGYLRGACLLAGITYRDRLPEYRKELAPPLLSAESETGPASGAYREDADGFLLNAREWDRDYALNKAVEMKIPGGLSEKHWRIINHLRESNELKKAVPTVYECCEANGIELDDLEKLFPTGYHRGAVKISGLRLQ